jgi:hypothetical protein
LTSRMAAPAQAVRLRLARRVTRLFRIERAGRLERRPFATARHLIERRAGLIDALIATGETDRGGEYESSPVLDQALHELAIEVERCRLPAEQRLAELVTELRLRRGVAPTSGVRGGSGGRFLGSG